MSFYTGYEVLIASNGGMSESLVRRLPLYISEMFNIDGCFFQSIYLQRLGLAGSIELKICWFNRRMVWLDSLLYGSAPMIWALSVSVSFVLVNSAAKSCW